MPRQFPGAIKIKLSFNAVSPLTGSRSVSIGQGKFDHVGPIQTEYSVKKEDHNLLNLLLSIKASSKLIPLLIKGSLKRLRYSAVSGLNISSGKTSNNPLFNTVPHIS